MSPRELTEFLNKKRYAVLATSRRDGRAHAAPIGFVIWKNGFWIASIEGARTRNLRNRPWASIVVAEGDSTGEHRAVIAEGPVELHKAAESGVFFQEYKKKFGRSVDWATIVIELNPERLFSYDGTKD